MWRLGWIPEIFHDGNDSLTFELQVKGFLKTEAIFWTVSFAWI